MALTLEQLKEENAKAEAEAAPTPQDGAVEDEVPAVEGKPEDQAGAEAGDDGEGKPKIEPWMQSGEEESGTDGHASDGKQFSGRDIAAAKKNLRAKLEKRHNTENEQYEARIAVLEETIKSGNVTKPAAPGKAARPKREDFADAQDPEGAYFDALYDWKSATNSASQHAESENAKRVEQVQEYETKTAEAVDQHYERAVELAEKSGIKPELYQAADRRVREMIEDVFPQAGDAITENLIATLGEGSERVMYNLGVNAKRREQLRKLLSADNSGLKAATYLGQLNAELSSTGKKRTSAPAPADDVTGDGKKKGTFTAAKRRYSEAHNKGDSQAAFNIRREARQAGADTSNW